MSKKPEEEVIAEDPALPLVEFALPFTPELAEDGSEVLAENVALKGAYFEHVRTALTAKSLEAIAMGATVARVRVFVDFE